jgi:hypothetical protein
LSRASSRAPAGTGVFLLVSGARSAEIELAGGDISAAATPVELGPSVAPDAVRKRAD